MNRDRRKWEGPLKTVHVIMHTAWHARAVALRAPAIKTTCQFHSLVDGHLGYSHVLDERRGKQQVNGKDQRDFQPGKSEGNFFKQEQKVQCLSSKLWQTWPADGPLRSRLKCTSDTLLVPFTLQKWSSIQIWKFVPNWILKTSKQRACLGRKQSSHWGQAMP